MIETGLTPLEIIKLYSGNGTFMLMFSLSLVYLWAFEKDKVKKALLVFMPLTLIILFVFPLFSNIFIKRFDEEGTYYRFLWLVPTGIVSSYTVFSILDRFKKKAIQIIAFTALIVCIMIGGVYMYEAPCFTKAENEYQLPQCVVDMCDDMRILKDREYEAVFPDEILQYPRQYTAFITMPYGFEMLQFQTGQHEDLHDEMIKDTLDVQKLTGLCEDKNIHYIVINNNKSLDGRFEDYNYEHVGSYGDYEMYKSTVMFYGPWDEYEEWKSNR